MAVTLTNQDTSDESQVGALLEQIEPAIEQVTAVGAYDGEPTYQMIAAHDANIVVVIPPRQDAIPSDAFETDPTPRNTHLLMIDSLGRLGWQEATGYGRRALVETTMGRYKSIIGDRPRSRGAPKPSSASRSSTGCSTLQGPTPFAARRLPPEAGRQRPVLSRSLPRCTNAK